MTTPFTFNEYVAPIQLPGEDYIPEEGTNSTVSGWGRISEGGDESLSDEMLQKVNIPIVSTEVCKQSSSAPSLLNDEKILCAGSSTGFLLLKLYYFSLQKLIQNYIKEETGFCEYDTGGPLVIEGTNIQIGIASIGYCGSQGKYGK